MESPGSNYRCKLRDLVEADRAVLADWIARDPFHPEVSPDFYFMPGTIHFAVEDHCGPIIFMRVMPVGVWAHFNAQFDTGQNRRTALALVEVVPRLADILKKAGMTAMIFTSVGPDLVAFCQKRLGFTPMDTLPGYFIRLL